MISAPVASVSGVAIHVMGRWKNLVLGLQEQRVTGSAKSNISPGMSNTKRDCGSIFRVKRILTRAPGGKPTKTEEETSEEEEGTFDNVAAVR